MDATKLSVLTGILQASISPVALISGVGLIILSQTNRFARVTDRLRELMQAKESGQAHRHVDAQLAILLKRARILRLAVSSAVGCVLAASLLVLALFTCAVLGLDAHWPVLALFAISLLCLIASLGLFLWDMHLSLKALHEELRS